MENLIFALNAVLPIILIMGLGYILKKKGFLTDGFVEVANKVVFKIALPVSLFLNIYNIQDISTINWSVVIFVSAVVFVLFGLSLLISILFVERPDQKGVIIQDYVRSNYAIIGTPLIFFIASGNSDALAVGSIVMLFVIPLTNVLAIIGLMLFVKDDESKVSVGDIALNIISNPIIIGILSGFAVLLFREFILPVNASGDKVFTIKDNLEFLYSAASQIAVLTTPLALLALGANFEFGEVKSMLKEVIIGTVGKIVIAPIIGLGLALLLVNKGVLNFGVNDYPALIAFFSAPAAVSSVVMASEMKNDGKLAAQIVVWSTMFSALTVFIIVFIFKSMGLIG